MYRGWSSGRNQWECNIKFVSIWNKLLLLHKNKKTPSPFPFPMKNWPLFCNPIYKSYCQKIQSAILILRGGWGEKNHSIPRNIYINSQKLNSLVDFQLYLAGIYLFKIIHGNIRTICKIVRSSVRFGGKFRHSKICTSSRIKILGRRQ